MKSALFLLTFTLAACSLAVADAPTETPVTTTAAPTTTSSTTTTTSTTTTSTVPPTTIPPTQPVGKTCEGWRPTAIEAGWPESEIDTLVKVLFRESTCRPTSHNPNDPMTGSYGLSQINGFWCRPTKYHPSGWLQEHGVLTTCEDLYDPLTNLKAALLIFNRSGWGPWGF